MVPAPSALAMPNSSPAGQGGAGVCFFDWAMTLAGSAASNGPAASVRESAITVLCNFMASPFDAFAY